MFYFEYSCIFVFCEGVTLEEFIQIMRHKLRIKDEDDEIRQAFLSFDFKCKFMLVFC